MNDGRPGPLAGIRVLEFAQVIAIPMCGAILADMGASVVKIEPPNGDSSRHNLSPIFPGESKTFAIFNRGKRSVCVNLGHAESRDVIDALVQQADVVLVAFKPNDVQRYGIGYERLSGINPRLVYLEHVPLGPKGPFSDIGGYDVLVQGLSGLGAITAAPGDAPRNINPAYADHATGMISALAVVTALRYRDQTGQGQRVETSLLSTSFALGGNLLNWFAATDPDVWDDFETRLAGLRANDEPFAKQQELYNRTLRAGGFGNVTFRHYRTADGIISVGALSPGLVARFLSVTGLVDPRRQPDFELGTPEAFRRLTTFIEEAEALFRTRTTAGWLAFLKDAGIPAAPFNFPNEAVQEPQIVENGYVVELDHPAFGPYKTFDTPFRMDATPVGPRSASPLLDNDTNAVLAEAGLADAEIRRLREAGAVGAASDIAWPD